MDINKFADELSNIYGDHLESVILYGSAANGEFHKGHSDYNTILILKSLAPVEVAKSTKLVKKWMGEGNPPPLFFTKQIILESADVFPIEFTDIKERHKVLIGTDPFTDIKIDIKNLRHQCEHELRSKLLNLRSKIAILSDQPKELIRLILESSSSFFAIFGGVLRLSGIKNPSSKKAVVEELGVIAGFDPSIFIEVIEVREKNRIWRNESALEKCEQYLTSISAVVRYVDSHLKQHETLKGESI